MRKIGPQWKKDIRCQSKIRIRSSNVDANILNLVIKNQEAGDQIQYSQYSPQYPRTVSTANWNPKHNLTPRIPPIFGGYSFPNNICMKGRYALAQVL